MINNLKEKLGLWYIYINNLFKLLILCDIYHEFNTNLLFVIYKENQINLSIKKLS